MFSLKFTRLFALFIATIMLVPTAFAYKAEEGRAIQPRYNEIFSFTVNFDISSAGLASCYSSAETNLSSYSIDLNMQLQRSSNGRTWSTIREWSSQKIQITSVDKTYYVSPGYDYRIHVTATVTNSSGRVVETATRDSSIVSY